MLRKLLLIASLVILSSVTVAALMQKRNLRSRLDRLTPRETEVLARMAEGDANPEIARKLVITDKAVEKHINSIFAKLDLHEDASAARRVQAVLTFLRQQGS